MLLSRVDPKPVFCGDFEPPATKPESPQPVDSAIRRFISPRSTGSVRHIWDTRVLVAVPPSARCRR
tara:strand:- start:2191 stop:2388 length:198 start_codon:yes stop_codon:yes gene_type:complete